MNTLYLSVWDEFGVFAGIGGGGGDALCVISFNGATLVRGVANIFRSFVSK